LYAGPKHPHYFGVLYPLYFIVISYFLSFLLFSRLSSLLVLAFFFIFIFYNSQGYYYLFRKGSGQIVHAKTVATFLNKVIDKNKFNFAVQPDGWQEDSYLYFLELENKIPADRKKFEITNQMYVVCGKSCDLYHSPSWNINMFGKFKIANEWQIENVKIYKLIH
jgi:hypothetical protein